MVSQSHYNNRTVFIPRLVLLLKPYFIRRVGKKHLYLLRSNFRAFDVVLMLLLANKEVHTTKYSDHSFEVSIE